MSHDSGVLADPDGFALVHLFPQAHRTDFSMAARGIGFDHRPILSVTSNPGRMRF